MVLYENEKSMGFEILGYEFPHKTSGEEYDYDANWLKCHFTYKDEEICEKYCDSCLMTDELSELQQELEAILTGESISFISDFLEPYLKFCFVRVTEGVAVVMHFVYDTLDGYWKTRKIASTFTIDEAKELLQELKEMALKYPVR